MRVNATEFAQSLAKNESGILNELALLIVIPAKAGI